MMLTGWDDRIGYLWSTSKCSTKEASTIAQLWVIMLQTDMTKTVASVEASASWELDPLRSSLLEPNGPRTWSQLKRWTAFGEFTGGRTKASSATPEKKETRTSTTFAARHRANFHWRKFTRPAWKLLMEKRTTNRSTIAMRGRSKSWRTWQARTVSGPKLGLVAGPRIQNSNLAPTWTILFQSSLKNRFSTKVCSILLICRSFLIRID